MPPKLYNRLSEVELLGPEYQAELQKPRPELGWTGDPDLLLAHHRLTGWEVLREEATWNGHAWESRHTVIAQKRPGSGDRIDVNELVRGLVARDTQIHKQSQRKAHEAYVKALALEEKEKLDRMVDAIAPVHEKLAWTTAKETDNLAPFIGQAGIDLPAKDAVDS